MLRFIIEHKFKHALNGCEGSCLLTIDHDIDYLETILRSGECSEDSFDRYDLLGVEMLKSNEEEK